MERSERNPEPFCDYPFRDSILIKDNVVSDKMSGSNVCALHELVHKQIVTDGVVALQERLSRKGVSVFSSFSML